MAKRPKKRPKRPRDVVGAAVRVMRIATGQAPPEETEEPESPAAELGRKGGAARAKKLSAKRRKEIAQKAAKARWKRRP